MSDIQTILTQYPSDKEVLLVLWAYLLQDRITNKADLVTVTGALRALKDKGVNEALRQVEWFNPEGRFKDMDVKATQMSNLIAEGNKSFFSWLKNWNQVRKLKQELLAMHDKNMTRALSDLADYQRGWFHQPTASFTDHAKVQVALYNYEAYKKSPPLFNVIGALSHVFPQKDLVTIFKMGDKTIQAHITKNKKALTLPRSKNYWLDRSYLLLGVGISLALFDSFIFGTGIGLTVGLAATGAGLISFLVGIILSELNDLREEIIRIHIHSYSETDVTEKLAMIFDFGPKLKIKKENGNPASTNALFLSQHNSANASHDTLVDGNSATNSSSQDQVWALKNGHSFS